MTADPPTPLTQDDLAAGKALDALIAEKVMGWQRLPNSIAAWEPPGDNRIWLDVNLPAYSSDMGAAWQIVEWAEASPRGWKLTLMRSGRSLPDYVWICTFHRGHVELARIVERSAPVAICKAALKAATCGSGPVL